MCDFCNDIPNLKDYRKFDAWDRRSSIIYDEENNKYHYWSECDDYYYTGIEIYDVKYCPMCGRKLNDG